MDGTFRGINVEQFREDGYQRVWLLALLEEEWLTELLSRDETGQFDYFVTLLDQGLLTDHNCRTIQGIHLERLVYGGETRYGGDYAVLESRILEPYSYGSLIDRIYFNHTSFEELTPRENRWTRLMLFRDVGMYNSKYFDFPGGVPWALIPFEARMQSWLFSHNFGFPYECIADFLEIENIDWLDMLEGEEESGSMWNLTNAKFGAVDYGNFYLRKSKLKPLEVRSFFFTTGKSTWYRENLVWVKTPLTSQLSSGNELRLGDPINALKHFDMGNRRLIDFEKWLDVRSHAPITTEPEN